MAIDKLNFSGINSGSKDFDTPLGSIADRLTKYGMILNQQDAEKAKQKRLDEQDAYQKQRDTLADTRYDEQQSKADAEKNRLLQKEYNTSNVLSSISDEKGYTAGRLATEQKAIQDTLASATPEERLKMQQELKGYDPKASGQQWVNTALSQSNVDSGAIVNLKGDLRKEAEQTRQFNENKRIAQENADRAYSLQKKEYDQRIQERADRFQEKKNESLIAKRKYEQFYDKNGNVATVDVNDPVSLDNASKSGFYNTEFIKLQGKVSKDGTTSGYESNAGGTNSFFNRDKKDYITNINYSSLGKDQQKKLDELSASTFRGTTGEKKEVINFLDKVDSVSKSAKLNKNEAEELVDLATGSSFGSEINLDKGVLDARYGKEVFATPDGTITKADALYNAFNRPETFKIVNVPQEGGNPDKKVFLDLTLPKHKSAYDKYSGIENADLEMKKIKETITEKPVEKNRLSDNVSIDTVNTKNDRLSNFLSTNPAPTVENLKIIEDISSSIKNKQIEERARALSNSMKTSGIGGMSEENKEEWKTLYNLIANPASKAYDSYQENVGKPFSRFVNENAPGGSR